MEKSIKSTNRDEKKNIHKIFRTKTKQLWSTIEKIRGFILVVDATLVRDKFSTLSSNVFHI